MDVILALALLLTVSGIMTLSVLVARRYGQQQLKKHALKKLEVVGIAEAAVFALLGLLLAFTFSGAYERFQMRKMHIIEEANAFETAYERIDLLAPGTQGALRQNFGEYLDAHLKTYQDMSNLAAVAKDQEKAKQLKITIWQQVLAATQMKVNQSAGALLIPAVNHMFETVGAGIAITQIHPPLIIYFLLIGLASLGGFLVGYNSAENKVVNSIHIVSYILLTAFTIYLIIDLEYPRRGLIRVSSFDHVLADVRGGF